jgi:hypothetical protein
MTWVFLCVFVGMTLYTALAGKDYFGPIRLYVIAYSFFLLINSLNLSRLQSPWSPTTHMLFWGSAFMIVASGFVIQTLDRTRGGGDLDFDGLRAALKAESDGFDWAWFHKVFVACTAIYYASYLAAFILFGKIPLFSSDPDNARIKFFGTSLLSNIGMFFGPLSLMLGVEMLIFAGPKGWRKAGIIAAMAVTLFLYLTIAMRLDLFRFGTFAVILYHYGKRRLGFKEFALVGCVAVAVFVAIFFARVHSDAVGQLNEIVKVKMPKQYIWASQIYAYVASNFWNMDMGFKKYVDGLGIYPHSWGYDLFRPWLFVLQVEGPMAAAYGFDGVFNQSVTFVRGMNSTVYIWHFWKDFGAAGVYVLSAAAALGASIFYANLKRGPTLFRIAIWGIFSSIILFSITAATWEFWFTYLNLIVIAIAHRKLRAL